MLHALKEDERKAAIDKSFGIHSDAGRMRFGNSDVIIDGDNANVAGKTYDGTPGLWELLVKKKPNPDIIQHSDIARYRDMLIAADAFQKPDGSLKWSEGSKWNTYVKDIYYTQQGKKAPKKRPSPSREAKKAEPEQHPKDPKGGKLSVTFLPSKVESLETKLKYAMGSYRAGNVSLRNEIVAICDELVRQRAMNKICYKQIMSLL